MDFIKKLRERAKSKAKRIVFPEAGDERVIQAVTYLVRNEICEVSLIGDSDKIYAKIQEAGLNPSDINILEPVYAHSFDLHLNNFLERRKHKELTRDEAVTILSDPLYFGAAMVAAGESDGCVAGAVSTTSQVLRAAIQVIGLRKDTSVISSVFLMAIPDGKILTYGDCGVVPYPDAEQLSDIAIESARTHQLLTGQEPLVAMLSFSTKGSAVHDRVELVKEALKIAKSKAPKLKIDGELQFDAAFVPEVARRKASGSKVAGKANVFIFPNLDAGNIAYKITERLAGASATGPILQGLARPMMDLSRGCSWQDIVNATCVAILMGENTN